MKKLLALALFLLTVVPLARAADPKAEAEARAKILAPFLDDETFAVVHLEVNPRNVDALVSRLTAIFKVNSAVLVPGKQLLNQWIADFNKAGGKDIYFLFNLEDVPLNPPFALVPLSADADAQALAGLLRQKPLAFEVTRPIHQVLFAGSKAQAQRLDNFTPMPRPEVAKALAAAGPGAAQFLLLPPASARRVIEEIMPTFPSEIGGGSTTILTRGVRWAALSYQTEPKLMLRLIIQSQDAESAQQFKQLVEDVLDFVGTKTPVQQWLPNFGQTAEKLTPEVHGDRLTLTVDEQTLSTFLVPAVQRIRVQAGRTQSMNNLKQIVLAMHNYHDVYKTFPPLASYDKKGKPLLSWRVLILPYLGEESLFKEFHLDEPWDSEHNKKLIPRMPRVYHPPAQKVDAGKTTYQGEVGAQTMFPGRQAVSIKDVTDGTSNTIFVVETDDQHAVIWTSPDDLKFDPEHPQTGLVGHYPDGFLAAFADGSVRFVEASTDPKTLRAYFTRNGGEVIP